MWTLLIAFAVWLFYKLIEPLLADHEAFLMGIGWLKTTWIVLQISFYALSNFDMSLPIVTVLWLIALGVFNLKSLLLRIAIKLIPGLGKILG